MQINEVFMIFHVRSSSAGLFLTDKIKGEAFDLDRRNRWLSLRNYPARCGHRAVAGRSRMFDCGSDFGKSHAAC